MIESMLIVREDEAAHAACSPTEMAELIEKRTQFVDELRRAGQLRDSGRLRPSHEGKRVRRRAEVEEVVNGPFAEDGRALCGYYWVGTANVEEAARLAARCPALGSDEIDVRPLMKGQVERDKEGKPGKIFAFAVIGNAPNESAWVEIMDRIDADTATRFPVDAFLGGVRLQAPTSGRRIATRGERRATFDGPFLESKEVIGGLFFLRMTSMSDAVRWARESRFVVHGTLEIRELWRS